MGEDAAPFGLDQSKTLGCGFILLAIVLTGVAMSVFTCSDARHALSTVKPDDPAHELVQALTPPSQDPDKTGSRVGNDPPPRDTGHGPIILGPPDGLPASSAMHGPTTDPVTTAVTPAPGTEDHAHPK